MKCLYFDCSSGIAGDMTIAALLDLKVYGINLNYLKKELRKIKINNYKIKAAKVRKKGLPATQIIVDFEQQKKERSYSDIVRLIDKSRLNEKVKNLAKRIFLRLAKAESKVHKTTLKDVHFHEVGAIDSIVDIVGASILIEKLKTLGIRDFYSSKISTGTGFHTFSHGRQRIPAPATRELLKGYKTIKTEIKKELTTPTGAVIITALVKKENFGKMSESKIPSISSQSSDKTARKKTKGKKTAKTITGFGAGTYNLEKPNVLKVSIIQK